MATLICDPAAKLEIREAAAYYEECRPGLGQAFLEAVEAAVTYLTQNPLHCRRIGGRFRRCLVTRFPYGVIYAVERDLIYIVAIMHLKRRPDYWKTRELPRR
jgi:toxin ParE1/3/4